MWTRFLALIAAPALALAPSNLWAQTVPVTGKKEILKQGKLREGVAPPRMVRAAKAATRVLRGASIRLGRSEAQVDTPRRFQVNLKLDGRRLVEFE